MKQILEKDFQTMFGSKGIEEINKSIKMASDKIEIPKDNCTFGVLTFKESGINGEDLFIFWEVCNAEEVTQSFEAYEGFGVDDDFLDKVKEIKEKTGVEIKWQ